MSDPTDDDDAAQLEQPPSEDELRAAESLRAALEQPSTDLARPTAAADDALLDVVLRARASLGRAAPLDAAVRAAAVDAALRAVPVDASARVVPVDASARVVPVDASARVVPVDVGARVVPVDVGARVVPVDVGARVVPAESGVRRAAARPVVAPTREAGRAAPWLAAAAALLVAASGAALAVRFYAEPSPVVARALPDDAYARPSDALFGGGLSPEQHASERLDAIVASRTRGYFSVLAANVATASEGAAK